MIWPTYDSEHRPKDLPTLIEGLFQRWTHIAQTTVPCRCALCGTPSKGNWLTGYYLPCVATGHPAHEEFNRRIAAGEKIEYSAEYLAKRHLL